MNEKEGKTILCRCCKKYFQGFNKYMKKENSEIIALVYMGKWWALGGVEPKFCLWHMNTCIFHG